MIFRLFRKIQPGIRWGTLILLLVCAGLLSCEREVPLSSFDLEYEPEYRIEADFYPADLGKSVLRIDRTFTIEDTLSMERAHITDASAELFTMDGELLSSLSWRDSAASYPYIINRDEHGSPFPPEDAEVDTQYYGAYKLDNLNFSMDDSLEYQLLVNIHGEEYRTTFSPLPPVDFINLSPDSVVNRESGYGGDYPVIYVTMKSDTASLEWPKDPEGYFYSVTVREYPIKEESLPNIFAFPGPVLSLGFITGRYEIAIGTMNRTFYQHYYLSDFPVNHETRNFFNGKALGYAGTLYERYLVVNIRR